MVEARKRYFSGRNVGQAVLAAAEAFSLPPELIAYEAVEGRHTSLKGTRRVVIAVDPEAPARARPAQSATAAGATGAVSAATSSPGGGGVKPAPMARHNAPEPTADGAPRQPVREPRSEGEREAVAGMRELVALSGLDLEIEADERSEELAIELSGPDRRLAVGRHGEVLRSFEHLLPRLLATEVEVTVDSAGFRARQDDQLRRLAGEVCDQVLDSGDSVLLDPYSPPERRVIHLVVQGRDGLMSTSEGEGFLKRVRVFRTGGGPDSNELA